MEEQNGISLMDLIKIVRNNIILIASIIVASVVIGFIYAFAVVTPQYTSKTKVIVMVDKMDTPSSSGNYDVSTAQKMVDSVADFMCDGLIVEAVTQDPSVIEMGKKAGITIDNHFISSHLRASSSTTKFIVTISFECENADLSKEIANSVATNSIAIADEKIRIFKDTLVQFSPAKKGVYSSPNKTLYLLVSFLLGCVLSLGVVFLKELLDNTFKGEKSLENATDLPVLGFAPMNINDEDDIKRYEPDPLFSENYEKLVINLDYANPSRNRRVYMVTSTIVKEGKTLTTMNLAWLNAKRGKKVLVVDLDLRKPRTHRFVKEKNNIGIIDYLLGDASEEEIIRHTSLGFDCVFSGKKSDLVLNLLSSEKLANFLETIKEKYDYVFIDTPPIAVCGDAILITKYCDNALYVVSSRSVKKSACLDSIKQMKDTKINMLGIFYTRVHKKDLDNGKRAYYEYNYSYKEKDSYDALKD